MLTSEQRQARRKYVGSSDAAAILGVDPYRSAADVWLEKTGKLDEWEGNEDTERGRLLEPAILDFAGEWIGKHFVRDQMIVAPDGIRAANCDGIASGFVVEAKSTVNADEYGDQGTDQIPPRVNVQVHHQMHVAGPEYRVAYVPVLLPGYKRIEFRMYIVERNEPLADLIAQRCCEFWHWNVLTNVRPEQFYPSLEVLKRIRREPKTVVPVADVLVDDLIIAKAATKQAKDDQETAERALLIAMGSAEGASYSSGLVTYLETKRKGYTVAETSYRTLRVKPAKEGSHDAGSGSTVAIGESAGDRRTALAVSPAR
jgi:putative phage-type endonuclease